MDPEFFRPADDIKLDIINDQTYQIEGIITEFDYDYDYDYGEMADIVIRPYVMESGILEDKIDYRFKFRNL